MSVGLCGVYEKFKQVSGGGTMSEKHHWEDVGLYGKIILKWIFKKWDVGPWTGLICLRIGTGGGLL